MYVHIDKLNMENRIVELGERGFVNKVEISDRTYYNYFTVIEGKSI